MISSDPYLSQKFQYRPNMTLAAVTLALLTAMRLNLNFQVLAGVNISFEIRTFQNTFRGGKSSFLKRKKTFPKEKYFSREKLKGKVLFSSKWNFSLRKDFSMEKLNFSIGKRTFTKVDELELSDILLKSSSKNSTKKGLFSEDPCKNATFSRVGPCWSSQLEPTLLVKSSWHNKKSLIWKLDLVQICRYMWKYAKLISKN